MGRKIPIMLSLNMTTFPRTGKWRPEPIARPRAVGGWAPISLRQQPMRGKITLAGREAGEYRNTSSP